MTPEEIEAALDNVFAEMALAEIARLTKIIEDMGDSEAEVERLKAWIAAYGRHSERCASQEDDSRCNCGLNAVLGETKPEETRSDT
jgi:hypothetical protein